MISSVIRKYPHLQLCWIRRGLNVQGCPLHEVFLSFIGLFHVEGQVVSMSLSASDTHLFVACPTRFLGFIGWFEQF